MKLKELRVHAEDFSVTLSRAGMGELLEDIGKELAESYRKGAEEWFKKGQVTAPADSELGIELSKIRDRLNALETHPERLGSSEKHIDRRIEALEQRTLNHADKVWSLQSGLELKSRVDQLEHRVISLVNWVAKVRDFFSASSL